MTITNYKDKFEIVKDSGDNTNRRSTYKKIEPLQAIIVAITKSTFLNIGLGLGSESWIT